MIEQDKPLKENMAALIGNAKSVAVIPSKIAGLDAYCAGLSIYYMFKNMDKNVFFVYPGKIPEGGENLIGESEITKDIKQRSLMVSVDYSGTEASKVNYSIEDDVLYLKISPIPYEYNTDQRIRARVTGFDFELIFVIGAQTIEDLGSTYKNLDTVSKISKLINIDITDRNERFGTINVIDTSYNTISLLLMQKLGFWGLRLDSKSAQALLKGILSRDMTYKG